MFQNVKESMRNKVILMRGLPGSGKSTRAKELIKHYEELGYKVYYFSTDDFWGNPYSFIPGKLREAHLWNQNRTMMQMINSFMDEKAVIIIDNTNTTAWELKPYVQPAYTLGFEIEIIEPSTPWAFDPEECAKRTIHSVPIETIRAMLARWEKDIDVSRCLCA
jgi:NEDD4-binding protein 2